MISEEEIQEKIEQSGTAVLLEAQFQYLFPDPFQWEAVQHFCLKTNSTCEICKDSRPRLYIFRKHYGTRANGVLPQKADFRMRRFRQLEAA
jgi:hypothetical protein